MPSITHPIDVKSTAINMCTVTIGCSVHTSNKHHNNKLLNYYNIRLLQSVKKQNKQDDRQDGIMIQFKHSKISFDY